MESRFHKAPFLHLSTQFLVQKVKIRLRVNCKLPTVKKYLVFLMKLKVITTEHLRWGQLQHKECLTND